MGVGDILYHKKRSKRENGLGIERGSLWGRITKYLLYQGKSEILEKGLSKKKKEGVRRRIRRRDPGVTSVKDRRSFEGTIQKS